MKRICLLFLLLFVGCGEVQPPPPPAPPPTPLKDFVVLSTAYDDNLDKLNAWLHENQGTKQVVGCTFITHRANNGNLSTEILLYITTGTTKFQRFIRVSGDAHALQDYLDQNPCRVICIAADPLHADVFFVCIEEK